MKNVKEIFLTMKYKRGITGKGIRKEKENRLLEERGRQVKRRGPVNQPPRGRAPGPGVTSSRGGTDGCQHSAHQEGIYY